MGYAMQGWKLARGRIARFDLEDQEIERTIERLCSGSARKVTSYKLVFLLSLLHSLDETDRRGRLSFSAIFARFARLYWVLVVEHGLRQCDASRRPSAVETALLDAFSGLGGAASLAALPRSIQDDIEKSVRFAGKKYVVGALYGDFRGSIYQFDLVDEYVKWNPAVLAYFRSNRSRLLAQTTSALGSLIARFNQLDNDEVLEIVRHAGERLYLDGTRRDDDQQLTPLSTAVGTHWKEDAGAAAPPGLSPQLSGLPVRAVISSLNIVSRLERAGYSTLGSLERLGHDEISRIDGLGQRTGRAVLETIEAIRSGRLDPTLSAARSIEEELILLVDRSGSLDVGRHVGILEDYYGLRGGAALTLEEIGEKLSISRERVRQLKAQVEEGVEDVLKWLHSRVLHASRVAIHQLGGLATFSELGVAITEVVPAGDYNPERFCRWLIARAHHPSLCNFGEDLVVGPPLGWERLERGVQSAEVLLSESRCVGVKELAAKLRTEWPDLHPELLPHHADVIASISGVRIMPGYYATSAWSRADWSEFVIESAGCPLHYREVAARVNRLAPTEYSEVGFNGTLNSDPRFVRVGAGDFALTCWGAKPYGRFDEVIERYLRDRADAAHEEEITADLLRTYTVTASTVTAMLHVVPGRFVHFGGGYWGLAEKSYQNDPAMEDRIVGILAGSSPQSAKDVHQKLTVALAGKGAVPSIEDVSRALYVSKRVVRHGVIPPQRFRCAESESAEAVRKAATQDVEDAPDDSTPTAENFFDALSW